MAIVCWWYDHITKWNLGVLELLHDKGDKVGEDGEQVDHVQRSLENIKMGIYHILRKVEQKVCYFSPLILVNFNKIYMTKQISQNKYDKYVTLKKRHFRGAQVNRTMYSGGEKLWNIFNYFSDLCIY